MFSNVVAGHGVILSLSKDGRATQGYLMPILPFDTAQGKLAQDDTVGALDGLTFDGVIASVKCRIVARVENGA